MYNKKPNFPRILFLFLLFLHLGSASLFAGIDPPGVLKPSHLSELKMVRDKATDKATQNLNRYAIDHLQSYESLLDSFSMIELRDSISLLEQEYNRSTGGRIDELAKNRLIIRELTSAKSSNLSRYNGLLKKAGIAFSTWFLIVIIVLQIRKRHLRNQSILLKENTTMFQAMLLREELGNKFILVNKKLLPHIESISNSASKLFQHVRDSSTTANTGSDKSVKASTIMDDCKELDSYALTELKNSRYIQLVQSQPSSDKIEVDINSICETALEIVSRGASNGIPADNLMVTKDLEKNLPKIQVIPESINALLLNILNNAFQAVKIKCDEGIKGYQPKVILSTRILPRFLQIRIRDNGDGIPKEQLEKILSEFYSLRPLETGAGLGLSDSHQLLGEPHKGEMRIESDTTEGTNVYIKFFL